MRSTRSTNASIRESPEWQAELELVRGFRDALGTAVDPGIVPTVVALRLLGFSTTGSCFGHARRATTGPYVMFQSLAAHLILSGHEATRPRPDRETLLGRARNLALRDADCLRSVVEVFTSGLEHGDSRERLRVRPIGHEHFRLDFVHAEFSVLLEESDLRSRTKARQVQLSRFTDYLIALLDDASD